MADEPQIQQHLATPQAAERPARLALYGGIALVALGLVVIYLGYNGAATNPVPQAQTPYVISGGLLGVGLMALGGIAIAVAIILRVQADFRTELNALRTSMESLSDAIAHDAFANGTSPTAVTNGTVMVARGASSFHRSDCKLVTRAEHVRPLPRAEADDTGLIPCRICKP